MKIPMLVRRHLRMEIGPAYIIDIRVDDTKIFLFVLRKTNLDATNLDATNALNVMSNERTFSIALI